ncbi:MULTISPECIES: DsrE family protein [Bradyrhizobium]|nr:MULTISPECIES: DsrE family protein [Bradyrhizobium]
MINPKLATAIISALAMLLLAGPNARAQQDNPWAPQTSAKSKASNPKQSSTHKQAGKPGQNHTGKRNPANEGALAQMIKPEVARKPHRLILQVNSNEPAMMNLALNNATNVAQYYRDVGEPVSIEVVTFGPGLHMLREDTSPVKPRIEVLAMSHPEISFKACGNTQENMHKAENKDISLIPQASVVKSGVVRVMELQEQGWSYVKP